MAPAPPSDNLYIGDLPVELTQEDVNGIFNLYGSVTDSKLFQPKYDGQKAFALVRFATVEEASWIVENLNGNIAEGLTDPIVVRFANAPGGGWKADNGDKGGKCGKSGKGEKADGWGGMGGNYGKSGKDIKGGFRPSPYGKEGKDGKDGKGVGKVSGKGFGKGLGKGVKGGDKAGSIRAVFATARKGGVLGSAEVPEGCAIYVNCLPPDTTDLDLYKLFSPFGAIAPSGIRAMMEDDGSCKGFGFVDFLDPTAADAAIVALNNLILPDGSSMNCSLKKPSLKGKGKGKDGSTGKATFEAE